MKKALVVVTAALLSFCAAAAFAQTNTNPYQRIQIVTIDDGDTIVAGVKGPDGSIFLPDPPQAFPSLIDYRYDFTPEMVKGSENL